MLVEKPEDFTLRVMNIVDALNSNSCGLTLSKIYGKEFQLVLDKHYVEKYAVTLSQGDDIIFKIVYCAVI